MARNGRLTAIDADGHILERRDDILPYLDAPWRKRDTPLWPGGQPWDTNMGGKLGTKGYSRKLGPAQQVAFWHDILDRYDMETAILFPTNCGNMAKLQEPGFAEATTKAANRHFAQDYMTERLKPVGVLPMRNPAGAAEELKRVKKLGLVGVEILTDGLPLGLGDPFFDPVWRTAEKLGLVIGIHGTRFWAQDWGADKLRSFAEVHAYAFPAGLIMQFTSILAQGVPMKFPKLKLAFLEVGATWLPYYLARLDEHWELRGKVEMPLLKKKPSEVFRKSSIYVSLEADEPLLAETIDYVGADHLLYASDIPHWDGEFPGNLHHVRGLPSIGRAAKQKILYENAKALFGL